MPALVPVIDTARFVPGNAAATIRAMPLKPKDRIYRKSIRALAMRAGIPRLRRSCNAAVERRVAAFVSRVLRRANLYREHQAIATLSTEHLHASLARERFPILFFGKMKK